MLDNDIRDKVVTLLDDGVGPSAIVKKLGVSRTSIYRIKDEIKNGEVKAKPADPLPPPPPTSYTVAKVLKEVPNPRLFLAEIDGKVVKVVKKEGRFLRRGALLRVQSVRDDLYRLV
jgi:hypothetical protein